MVTRTCGRQGGRWRKNDDKVLGSDGVDEYLAPIPRGLVIRLPYILRVRHFFHSRVCVSTLVWNVCALGRARLNVACVCAREGYLCAVPASVVAKAEGN